MFAAESLHSKAAPTEEEEEDEEFDEFEDGVWNEKETVEAFPSAGGLLVIAGGSKGSAEAQAPLPVAATSRGESPARTLAAAAAPWTVSANGWDPPRGRDLPRTTIEIAPEDDDDGGEESPAKVSGTDTRSTLLAESLAPPPLPSSSVGGPPAPPGTVTSRSRSLTRADAAAGEGGLSVQASVTTSGDGGGLFDDVDDVDDEEESDGAFSRQKRTTPPCETVTLSANARPHEL